MIFKNGHSNRIYELIFLVMELNSPKSNTLNFLVFLLMSHWHGRKNNSYVTNIVFKYGGNLFCLKQIIASMLYVILFS